MKPDVGRLGLLDMLEPSVRADFLRHGREVFHAAGAVIHREGDADRALEVVVDGRVALSRLDEQGYEVQAWVLEPGDSFGEIPLLTGRPRTHMAVAVTAVRLLRLTQEQFIDLLDRHVGLRDVMMSSLAGMLADLADAYDRVQRLSVAQRVSRHLLQLAAPAPDRQVLAVGQGEIARALNVTREAVAGALRQMRADGLVETGYRAITLLSLQKLRGLR
ncbi:Crp/Fnr family transcriptional regulator [Pseudoduganella sp. OTU4001]|uniref:Crp/Fnr family transcriptional regulator n=1 Tax=Pseudoduganella sp. OTU4001 TaxID=3043854 RepID=UPI00313C109F